MIGVKNQRWELGHHRWSSPGDLFRPSEHEVFRIEGDGADETAQAFIAQHHYSKAYPSARFRYGLSSHGRTVGMAVFSYPCNDRVLTNVFPVEPLEAVELGRFVLLDGTGFNSETWFLARCFEMLRQEKVVEEKTGRELRGVLGVVSFSDPMPRRTAEGRIVLPGHIGQIYAAHNGCYLGRGDARTVQVLPNGTSFHHRGEQKIKAAGATLEHSASCAQCAAAWSRKGPRRSSCSEGKRLLKRSSGWRGCVQRLEEAGAAHLLDAEGHPMADPGEWFSAELPKLNITRLRHRGCHKYAWALAKTMRRGLISSGPYPKQIDAA